MKKTLWALMTFLTVAGVTACGGGGGATVASSDPGTTYKGTSSHARIREDNAVDLAFGAYAGGNLGSSLGWGTMAKRVDAPPPVAPNLTQLTSSLKISVLQLIASEAQGLQKGASPDKILRRTANFDLPGWFGGVASYSLEVNDSIGSFSGTVRFVDFTTDRYTFTGIAEVTGTVDQAQQAINFFTLSFTSLKVSNGYTLDLTGSISWTFDLSAPADTMAMNMVLLDESSGKTYWFKDYILTSTYGYEFMIQDISGRYFDPDHGYVNFATNEAIVIDYFYEWPRQGTITFSGSGRTSVRLTFNEGRVVIGADLDGDTIDDMQDEYLLYVLQPDAASSESGAVLTIQPVSSPGEEISETTGTPYDSGESDINGNGENGNTDNSDGNGSNGPSDEASPIHDDPGQSPGMASP